MTGTLYLVATPIGNLEDVSARALAVLRAAAVVACEDTRRTGILLDRFGIATPRLPLHEHNEARASAALLARLAAGEDVALVSDAGMPLLSDPGYELVRAAIEAGVRVVPVPGASAPLAALAVSGLPPVPFAFVGFLPHRVGERRRMLESFAAWEATLVAFESPLRVAEALADAAEILGERPAAVCRELTKIHEEVLRGSLGELARALAARGGVKGEITLVIGGAGSAPQPAERASAQQLLERYLAQGLTRQEAMRQAAKAAGMTRKAFYAKLLATTS